MNNPLNIPILEGRHLKKTYQLGRASVPVLLDASLEIQQGEWMTILGSSGSGKSTVLHLLGGLDRPDAGGGGEQRGSVNLFLGESVGYGPSRHVLDPSGIARASAFDHLLSCGFSPGKTHSLEKGWSLATCNSYIRAATRPGHSNQDDF